MLKLLIKIVTVITLTVVGIILFIKIFPWLLAIVAAIGTAIELYYLWLRSRNEGSAAQQ